MHHARPEMGVGLDRLVQRQLRSLSPSLSRRRARLTPGGRRTAAAHQPTAQSQGHPPLPVTPQHILSKPPPDPARTAPYSMADPSTGRDYFCQVRFLWRCARNFLRRLCLLIFAFRRFFSEPIICFYSCCTCLCHGELRRNSGLLQISRAKVNTQPCSKGTR